MSQRQIIGGDSQVLRRVVSLLIFLMISITGNAQQLVLSHPNSGFFDEAFTLKIQCDDCDSVKYALNVASSRQWKTYSSGIEMLPSAELSKAQATIPTNNPLPSEVKSPYYDWEMPTKWQKANTIEIWGFKAGGMADHVTKTYWVGVPSHHIPVISMITDSAGIFSNERGIFVPGNSYTPQKPLWSGNYRLKGKTAERPTFLEYIDVNGETLIEQQVGIRAHGMMAVTKPQKSIKVYARSEYGARTIEPSLLDTNEAGNYKRMVLRSAFSSWSHTIFEDLLIHNLLRKTNTAAMPGHPIALYLNGEYWGIHNLQERVDERYVARKFDLDKDEIIISNHGKLVEERNLPSHESLNLLLKDSNLSPDEFAIRLAALVNMNSFMDYLLVETYFRNGDWPKNNVTIWRQQEPGSKWRFIFTDLDACVQEPSYDMFFKILVSGETIINLCTRQLFQSEAFGQRLLERYELLKQKVFNSDVILANIERHVELYAPEIQAQVDRWHFPESFDHWEARVDSLRNFAVKRQSFFEAQLSKACAGIELRTSKKSQVHVVIWIAAPILLLLSFLYWRRRKRMSA
jgi:hypothetical protein